MIHGAKRLSDKIEIWELTDFATPEECDEIIQEASRKGYESSTVDDPTNHNLPEGRKLDNGRTSSSSFVVSSEAPVLTRVGDRVKAIVGDYVLEGLQVQRYENTQRYNSHYDTFDGIDGEEQRNYTAMMYLNDIPEGGGTFFGKLGLRIQPRKGTLILWNNLLPNGCRDPNTLHAGEPVTGNETKYITTFWFRKKKGDLCPLGPVGMGGSATAAKGTEKSPSVIRVEGFSVAAKCGMGFGVLLVLLALVGLIVFLVFRNKSKKCVRR